MTLRDRIFGRPVAPARKASYGDGWLNAYQQGGIPLEAYGADWQQRAARYLAAYRVGWFYKAGSRISRDFANLPWTLAYEDTEGDNEEEIVAPANNIPFDQLDPLEQFLRLSERPNPYESGRQFKQRQQIRLDFTGRALVYLEGGDMGLPTAYYGINPCRMWKSYDAQGHLVGWVMDKNASGGGVPFSADEIVAIEYPGADDDPVGAVEAVYSHVPLTQATARHVADVLATGGRLAGMAWPKERSLTEDEFQDAQRAWRSVTSDPNAARRLLLFPEPMEYTAGAATPSEIGIPELAALTRDEVLTAFPIAPEMLMVPMATGLNSGGTQAAVEARYWTGTMHPRVEVWEDAFQTLVIPKYEAVVGRPLDFDIDEPDLDDAPSLIEKVGAFKGLISVGFDPKEAVSAAGLDGIKWLGLPDTMNPAKQAEAAAAATAALASQPAPMMDGPTVTAAGPKNPDRAAVQQPVAKTTKSRREQVVGEELPGFQTTMHGALTEQRDRLADEIERVIGPLTKSARKALPDDWWDQKREDLFLRETLRGLYLRLSRSALQVVSNDTDRFVTKSRIEKITERMLEAAAERITGINEVTRKAVNEAVSEGVRRGYTIGQIVSGVSGEAFTGVKQLPAFDEARAELVARTETMLAYNESALRGYDEFGVAEVEAIDGDGDPECAERHGQVFSIEDALAVEEHPNGTLDWAPISKSQTERHEAERLHHEFAMKAIDALAAQAPPVINLTIPPSETRIEAPITVSVPEQAAPVVNVAAAEAPLIPITVNVPEQAPATVTVTTPEQRAPIVNVQNTMPEPFITVEAPVIPAPIVNVTVPAPKPTTRTVTRGADGSYTVTEVPDGD